MESMQIQLENKDAQNFELSKELNHLKFHLEHNKQKMQEMERILEKVNRKKMRN
jgi:uncharacterized membrane protein YjjP (DUF1212 family)